MSKARELSDYTGLQADITAGDTAAKAGRKNLIINGDMKVAQRATSVTGLGANGGTYSTVDRYRFDFHSTAGRLTATQTAITDLAGFSKCTKLDCTTADTSIAAGESFQFVQRLEGQDIQKLAYGTSSAKTTTVSFYVKGTAKTYMCELHDAENTRLVQQQFNVTTSWTRVSLTFAGNTSGTIADSAALGLYLNFWLHAGSTYTSGTYNANTWKSQVNADRAVGIGSFFSSTSNELFITGIQFETGSVATDFEHRTYAENLLACQRYYEIIADGGYDVDHMFGIGHGVKSDQINWFYDFKAEKRAAYTLIVASVSGGYHAKNHSVYKSHSTLGMTATVQSLHSISAYMTSISGVTEQSAWTMQLNGAACHIAVSAEL